MHVALVVFVPEQGAPSPHWHVVPAAQVSDLTSHAPHVWPVTPHAVGTVEGAPTHEPG